MSEKYNYAKAAPHAGVPPLLGCRVLPADRAGRRDEPLVSDPSARAVHTLAPTSSGVKDSVKSVPIILSDASGE